MVSCRKNSIVFLLEHEIGTWQLIPRVTLQKLVEKKEIYLFDQYDIVWMYNVVERQENISICIRSFTRSTSFFIASNNLFAGLNEFTYKILSLSLWTENLEYIVEEKVCRSVSDFWMIEALKPVLKTKSTNLKKNFELFLAKLWPEQPPHWRRNGHMEKP